MKKTINLQSLLQKNLLYMGAVAVFLGSFFFGVGNAHALISSTLDLGSNGSDVTQLQSYLALDSSLYPSGLVTGYFGPLTAAGVERFQVAQGIVSAGTPATTGFGRVGPTTMMRLNSLMGGTQAYFDASPTLSPTSVQYNSNSATFKWTTNEATQGQVYYNDSPLVFSEATGSRQQPYVSGAYSTDSSGLTSHSITVQNLQPNTTYYFLTRAIDNMGNMSMTWPSSFKTNQ